MNYASSEMTKLQPIIGLETYEPEQTLILSLYIERLQVHPDRSGSGFHVWAITGLGRAYRVTERSFDSEGLALRHVSELSAGMSEHLRTRKPLRYDREGSTLDVAEDLVAYARQQQRRRN